MTRYEHQRITADPARGDGHNTAGIPGDCLKTAVAGMLGLMYEDVPHFALYRSWWDTMRRYARRLGGDFACFIPVDGSMRDLYRSDIDVDATGDMFLASGPSPRGPFWHTVIVDVDLNLVHDPHPSGAGVLDVREVFAWVAPYDPPPTQHALTTGKARTCRH